LGRDRGLKKLGVFLADLIAASQCTSTTARSGGSSKMHLWRPDTRFPLFFSHFLIFYLLLCLPTVGFCLAALVLQTKRYASLYGNNPCYVKEVVAIAIAFPTSAIALVHAVVLLLLASRHRLTVKGLLWSSLIMGVLWIPALVTGWQPYYSYYDTRSDSLSYSRCYSVTGLFLESEASYYYNAFRLTSRLQVLMGVIIMTFSTA
jgi:hypothetical protein